MTHSHTPILPLSTLLLLGGSGGALLAQEVTTASTGNPYSVVSVSATPVFFHVDADLSQQPIPDAPLLWGMDVAWDSEDNVRRGTNYIGKEDLSVGRVSFQPSDLVGEGDVLSAAQQAALQRRLNHIALSGVKDIVLNCDHEVLCNKDNYPNCDQNYANYYGKPEEWLKVIRASVKYCRNKGFNVVTISPFNEPDYTNWKEGTKAHFKEIARLISEDPELQGIRISAGNTLNCDQADSWYTAVKPYATEGNTHQLAGSFDNYAAFWQKVRRDGNHATADELHNVGEAFIGAHYGMQTGIWWGWDGAARGEYCKASRHGKEIGYGENRSAWAAATVYKREDGRTDAFLGTSERQAYPSSFEFVSADRLAYFDGYGPYYNYVVDMPGGTGYQQGQVNAERMVGIQYGEDVPADPITPGNYVIMNANSKMCLSTYDGSTSARATVAQRRVTGTSFQAIHQWTVESLPAGSGGDQGYFLLRWVKNTSYLIDVNNWSTSTGASLIAYPGGKGTNEQWFVEYAGDNYWYIRSRHSGFYMEVEGASTSQNAAIKLNAFTGNDNQKWRFLPAEEKARLETTAPDAPTGLRAEAGVASVRLTWEASASTDVKGYRVVRDGDVIARCVTGTEFIDNDVRPDMKHLYHVKAMDQSRNLSAASEEVETTLSDQPALLMRYTFEKEIADKSGNEWNPMTGDTPAYQTLYKKEGTAALNLNGSASRYLMLPANVGYYDRMTLSMWVYASKISNWMRIFDFGNGTDQYMFLTPSNGSEMRLVFKNGGEEQVLSTTKLKASGWHFVAVTLDTDSVSLYVDGQQVKSTDITIRPTDFLPKHNFLGWSQFASDPAFTGYLDDVRFYNFPLTVEQLDELRAGNEPVGLEAIEQQTVETEAPVYTLDGRRLPASVQPNGLYMQGGKMRMVKGL